MVKAGCVQKIYSELDNMERSIKVAQLAIGNIKEGGVGHNGVNLNNLYCYLTPEVQELFKVQLINLLQDSIAGCTQKIQMEFNPLAIANKLQEGQ